ncbi:MAG: Fic family protein [Bacteroidetes bacterium]|nr:Fic family protein [Bacteroidota bacterium]
MEKKLIFDFNSTQQIINLIGRIDSFRGRWLAIEKKDSRYLKDLRHIATIESTGASTRIEGATLTDKAIETLLNSVRISKIKSREEQEVVGYYETLDVILDNYESIPLSENYIKQLHGIVLKYSSKDSRHRGEYKSHSNKVVANYPGGKQAVIFNTTEPYLVKKEMDELLDWTNRAFAKGELHPLIITGAFVYEFLSIHPFQDGNGRISRLLTNLLLLKHGYLFIHYISFEHLIEERKKNYFRALMSGQKNRYKKNENISQWILFLLDCLSSLIIKLEKKYETYNRKGAYLNGRQKKVVAIIKKHAPVKLSDILSSFPGISRNTLKKDLLYLVNENVIFKTGAGKSTVYGIKEPVDNL